MKRYFITGGLVATILLGATLVPADELDNLEEVRVAQEDYYQKHGKYLQVLKDNKLPHYEEGTVKEKLGKDLAANTQVDVYQTPDGQRGYQIYTEDDQNIYTTAYGPEAAFRTSVVPKPIVVPSVASTTSSNLFYQFLTWLTPLAHALTSNSHSTDLENGSNQFWTITDAAQTGLDYSNDFSISMRVYLESTATTPDNRRPLAGKGTNSSSQYSWYFLWDNQNSLLAAGIYHTCDASSSSGVTDAYSLPTATWVMLSLVKDDTTVRFYVNDAQEGTDKTVTSSTVASCSGTFAIGRSESDGGSEFDGLVDDVRTWDRALSGAEIASLYSTPCTFDNSTNLQGWWLFDNDAGVDQTANNNDLTNNNTATFSTTHAYDCPVSSPRLPQDMIIFE